VGSTSEAIICVAKRLSLGRSPRSPWPASTFVPTRTYRISQCATHCVARATITAAADGILPATLVLAQYNLINNPAENCDTSLNCRFEAVSTTDSSDPSATLPISFAGH
jgi:hypothetical protein